MEWLKALWDSLLDEDHRERLYLIGGALSAIVGWVIYWHKSMKKNSSLTQVTGRDGESAVSHRDWDIQDAIEWWENFANKKKEEDGIEFIDTLPQLVQDGVEDGGIAIWRRPGALHHPWERIDKKYWKKQQD